MRGVSAADVRGATARGARWLRAELRDTVRVEPVAETGSAPATAEIGPGLQRWSGRLSRRRAVAVTRRVLLVVLAIAAIAAIVILATGGNRPLWLLAILLLAPLGGLVSLLRAPSQAQTARVLDRGLGLHERLGTALELRAAPAAPTGLGAMVVDEASTALGRSFSGARVVGRRATAEWAWLVALACVLGLAIALPRPSTGSSSGAQSAVAQRHAAGGPGAAGRHGGRRATATNAAKVPPIPTRSAPPAVGLDSGSQGSTKNPYGGVYRGGHLEGKAQVSTHVGGQAGLNLAGGGSSKSSHSGAGAGAGGKSGGAGAAGGGGAASSRKLTAGGGGVPQSNKSRTQTPASHASKGNGAQQGGGAPPGGESAGATEAGANQGSGVVPVLGSKQSGLPLQAGFAPVHGAHGAAHGGVSQEANGGGGQGKTAEANGTVDAGGSQGRFPAIPPTFNSPSSQSDLLQNYFGGSNQLTFKAW
jgi:hypothetical protein